MAEYEEGDLVVAYEAGPDHDIHDYTSVVRILEEPPWIFNIGEDTLEKPNTYKVQTNPDSSLQITGGVHKDWIVGKYEDTTPEVDNYANTL